MSADDFKAIRSALEAAEVSSRTRFALPGEMIKNALAALDVIEEEIADMRISVLAFGAPSMVEMARLHGLPRGHLFSDHYDILRRAGGRMDDFTRGEKL